MRKKDEGDVDTASKAIVNLMVSVEMTIHHCVEVGIAIKALTLEDVTKDNIVISNTYKYATFLTNTTM